MKQLTTQNYLRKAMLQLDRVETRKKARFLIAQRIRIQGNCEDSLTSSAQALAYFLDHDYANCLSCCQAILARQKRDLGTYYAMLLLEEIYRSSSRDEELFRMEQRRQQLGRWLDRSQSA